MSLPPDSQPVAIDAADCVTGLGDAAATWRGLERPARALAPLASSAATAAIRCRWPSWPAAA